MPGYTPLEVLVFWGCAIAIAAWTGISAFVVANRAWWDLRERELIDISRAVADPVVAALPPLERSPGIRRILSRLSRRRVYQMVATEAFPSWLTEICAAYSLEHLGINRIVLDASAHSGRTRWRRISALFALGYMRADGVHDLLAAALQDTDPEVAAAAATVLHRLGDRRAAAVLISALRGAGLPPSRIATHLGEFPIPTQELLRPLLHDENSAARYWAASLLCQPGSAPAVVDDLALVAEDPDAFVRKAALASLGRLDGSLALPFERRALKDSVGYVRSTAVRAIGQQGSKLDSDAERQRLASWIAPLLGDPEWEVRLATKEALTGLGDGVWREVAGQLQSADGFARDGAAEVLQDLEVLDWAVSVQNSGATLGSELAQVLDSALREGGPTMVDALAERAGANVTSTFDRLWSPQRFVDTS